MPSTISSSAIKKIAHSAGYDDCGIIPADRFVRYAQALQKRIADFPDAAPLYMNMRTRIDPRVTAPWAQSIVVCVRWYGKYRIPPGLDTHFGRHYLFDRRLKKCPDSTIPGRMKQGLRDLGLRVKPGGVPERWAAALAGVARFGRNNFAYSDTRGSWINIESYRVDARIDPDEATLDCPCPEGCARCRDACPTGAIDGPFSMRMDRCVAHLTYSAPHPIDPELWEKMGPWIYGCDACQRVCPLNRGKWREENSCDWLRRMAPLLTPHALATMDEKTCREKVHPAFWYIDKEDIARWHANARRAAEYDHDHDHDHDHDGR